MQVEFKGSFPLEFPDPLDIFPIESCPKNLCFFP